METSPMTTNTDLVDDNHNITLQLKEEVQVICEKLASYGEESVFISTNRIENTSSFRGSKFGQDFILKRLQIIDQFYNSCMGYTPDQVDFDEQKNKSIESSTENRETSNKRISDIGTRPFIPSPAVISRSENYHSGSHGNGKSRNISERFDDVVEKEQSSNCDEKGESSDYNEGVGFEMYISTKMNQHEQTQQHNESHKADTETEEVQKAVNVSSGLQHKTQDSCMECNDDSERSNDYDSVYDQDEKSEDSELNDLGDEESEKMGNLEETAANVHTNTNQFRLIDDDDDDDEKIKYMTIKGRLVSTRKNKQKEKASVKSNTHNTRSRELRSKTIKTDKVISQTTQTSELQVKNSGQVGNDNKCMLSLKRVNTSKNVITLQKVKLAKPSLIDDQKPGTETVLISGARPNTDKNLHSGLANTDAKIKTGQGELCGKTQKSAFKSSKGPLNSVFTVKQLSDCKAKNEQKNIKMPVSSTGMSVKKMFLVRNNKSTDSSRITVKNNTRTAKSPTNIKNEEVIPKSASIVYPDGHVEQVPVEAKKEPCDKQDESEGKIMVQGEKKSYLLFLNNKPKEKRDSQKDDTYMSYKDNAHLCNVCGKIYKHKKNLKDHMFKHSGDYPFSCPLCDRKFPKRGPMQTHLNNHLEYKMFMCEFCGKRFASSGLLGEHRKVHREGKPYVCRVCDKRFPRKTYLTKHMKFHKENKEYMCEECGKRFFTSTHLKRHYLIHTGIKQYRCTLCPYECNQSGNLKIHMKVHKRDLE